MHRGIARACAAATLVLGLAPSAALACPVCFGQTDSPLAAGVNWGIFLLLAVLAAVLGGFISFFIYLFKRSRALVGEELATPRSVRKPCLRS